MKCPSVCHFLMRLLFYDIGLKYLHTTYMYILNVEMPNEINFFSPTSACFRAATHWLKKYVKCIMSSPLLGTGAHSVISDHPVCDLVVLFMNNMVV